MNEIQITIRSIQHYLYCPHRWGLIEIDRAWAENAFVTKADIMHERVHSARDYALRGKKAFCGVNVYNDDAEYGIYGVCDLIEGSEDINGAYIRHSNKNYKLTIVEYKPKAPKGRDFNYDDAMQVFAQKICADKIFKIKCDAVLYYADTKKRVRLPFDEEYDKYNNVLQKLLNEMRRCIEAAEIPAIIKGQKCSGCSLKELCMAVHWKTPSVRQLAERFGDNV